MDRIESDKTIEINGKRMFSDGDPNAEEATEGTEINAQFLNGIQEEICGFIESQGIALDHSKKNQLTHALNTKLEPYRIAINKIIAVIKAEVSSGVEIDEVG